MNSAKPRSAEQRGSRGGAGGRAPPIERPRIDRAAEEHGIGEVDPRIEGFADARLVEADGAESKAARETGRVRASRGRP
jgi:hypothetical protein